MDIPLFDFDQYIESDFRVQMTGELVGLGGYGLTLWFESEFEAIAGAESEFLKWPGAKQATIHRRDVIVSGERKRIRKFEGLYLVHTMHVEGRPA